MKKEKLGEERRLNTHSFKQEDNSKFYIEMFGRKKNDKITIIGTREESKISHGKLQKEGIEINTTRTRKIKIRNIKIPEEGNTRPNEKFKSKFSWESVRRRRK